MPKYISNQLSNILKIDSKKIKKHTNKIPKLMLNICVDKGTLNVTLDIYIIYYINFYYRLKIDI